MAEGDEWAKGNRRECVRQLRAGNVSGLSGEDKSRLLDYGEREMAAGRSDDEAAEASGA